MTAYSDGRRLEYATQNELERNGYITVRTAGSHGAVDVLGFKQGEIVMVQCKLTGKLGPAERTKVYGLAAMVGAVPLVARWHKDGRSAREVRFERLLSPLALCDWTPDHGFERIA